METNNFFIEYFDARGRLLLRTDLVENTGHSWRLQNALNHNLPVFSYYKIKGYRQACCTMKSPVKGCVIWRSVDVNNRLHPIRSRRVTVKYRGKLVRFTKLSFFDTDGQYFYTERHLDLINCARIVAAYMKVVKIEDVDPKVYDWIESLVYDAGMSGLHSVVLKLQQYRGYITHLKSLQDKK